MKKISTFFLLFIYFSLTAENETPFATQIISFLTDDSDPSSGNLGDKSQREIALMARTLYLHLIEQQSILVVTSSVFHALMQFLNLDDNPMGLVPEPHIKPSDFITQQINKHIFVVVPKKYITSRSNYKRLKQYLGKENKTGYSIEELTVGMPLRKPEIPSQQFFNPNYYQKTEEFPTRTILKSPIIWTQIKDGKKITNTIERRRPASWISKKVVEALPDIFISQDVYKKFNLLDFAPTSVIIAAGHGSAYVPIHQEIKALQKEFGKRALAEIDKLKNLQKQGYIALLGGEIAGFDSHDFADFVAYITKHIKPSLMFFNTCYGSGINVEAALRALKSKEEKELRNLTIPYVVISGAVSNAPVYETTTIDDIHYDNDPNNPIEKSILRKPLYNKFLNKLNSKKQVSDDFFIDALDTIYTLYGDISGYNNIPIIKYPNKPWRPINMPDKLIIIDQQFVSTYQNQKSVSLSSLFSLQTQPHPRVVLLAVPEIPFELTIEGNDLTALPIFVSYEPAGSAIHRIKKITASSYRFSDVIHNFFTIQDLKDNKIVLLDQLTTQNDISLLQKPLNKPFTINTTMLIHRAPLTSSGKERHMIKFHYQDQDWQADITTMPLQKALQKDNSGLFQEEWNELVRLTKK